MPQTAVPRTALLTIAHGTRNRSGNELAIAITEQAATELGMPGAACFVELAEPSLGDAFDLIEPGTRVAAVPLLLSVGVHLRDDLPSALAESTPAAQQAVRLGRSFGPHALLARAQAERLREAGAEAGCRVVMVAAGSSQAAVDTHLERARELLEREWGGPVVVATMTARGSRPADVVKAGDAVSPYLIAPGFFADRLTSAAHEAGATAVAEVIGDHPAVIELIARRARALLV